MNIKNNKKTIVSIIVGVSALLVLIIGSTYAYFSVNTSNNYGTRTITGAADSTGSVVLNGTNASLKLYLTGKDMMKDDADITYWGTSDGTPSITQNIVTIGSTEVVGNGYYNCDYTLNVAATGTNNMYTAFQGMSGKSTEQIVLKVGDTKYDFNTSSLFPITINGTLNGVTSSDVQSLTAEFYVINKEGINQDALQGTDININISATDFKCIASSIKPASESILELLKNDSTVVKYVGKVTDTVEQIGTGVDATNVYAFTSNDNNNLVFAGSCWQIRRTTENGGLKIQYNGEPTLGTSDGETTYDCGTTRPGKMQDIYKTTQSLNGTYLYGTGYTTSVSGNNTTFTLTGTQSVEVTSSNAATVIPTLIGKYTCRNTTGTCTNSALYKVASHNNANSYYNAYTYASTYRDSIASAPFNDERSSLSDIGYMYKSRYPVSSPSMTISQSMYSTEDKYLFGQGLRDNGNGTFSLTGTIREIAQKDWPSSYNNVYEGMYVCLPGYYTYNSSTGVNTCSDNSSLNMKNAIGYVKQTTNSSLYYHPMYRYGYGVEKVNNSFELVPKSGNSQTLQYIYNWSTNQINDCFYNSNSISECGYRTISNSHYTCFNLSGKCNTYYYIGGATDSSAYSIAISEGKVVNTNLDDERNVLFEMFNNNQINSLNSNAKQLVDLWYKSHLLNTNYEKLIDSEAVFCNDRKITNFGYWNPDGGNTVLEYTNAAQIDNLACSRNLDSFSKSNGIAKLDYPIGLMSAPEMIILANNTVRSSSNPYWLISPQEFNAYFVSERIIVSSGSISGSYTNNAGYSVRPAISLNSLATIASGTGSTSDPFIVKGSEMTP